MTSENIRMAHALNTTLEDSGILAQDSPLLELISKALGQYADRVAVRLERTSLTYAEIDKKSRDLANMILQLRLSPQAPVAVCLTPGIEVVVSFVAILRAGMVYVPINPNLRHQQLRSMIETVGPALVLVQRQTENLGPLMGIPSLLLDIRDLGQTLDQTKEGTESTLVMPIQEPSSRAAVFFTSGISSSPKAVPLSHGNIAFSVGTFCETYCFNANDIFLGRTGLTSSSSLFEFFSPWVSGGQVWLLPTEKERDISYLIGLLDQVTVIQLCPGLIKSLLRYFKDLGHAKDFPQIRHVLVGGDVVTPTTMERVKILFPKANLYVLYGCTEISGVGTTFLIPRDTKVTSTNVGKPFKDVKLKIVDSQDREVSTESVGEICISSSGLMRGYLGQDEEKNDLFFIPKSIHSRLSSQPDEPEIYYRTGDLGRMGISGQLEFLGRRENQIYTRGIPIEIFAVEDKIVERGFAEDVALAVEKDGVHENYIAYVTKPQFDNIRDLRSELARYFPDYMLPQEMVVLGRLPYRSDYKINRRTLTLATRDKHDLENPVAAFSIDVAQKGQVPRRDFVESQIVGIFSKVLLRNFIELDEDFFDLGGNSLQAIITLQELEKTFGPKIKAQDFFRLKTPRKIAAYIESGKGSLERPFLLNHSDSNDLLFMVSGMHCYRHLAAHLSPLFSCYGIFSNNEVLSADLVCPRTVTETAKIYLEMIQSLYPDRSYHLLGYSFGGILAYEMAQILVNEGKAPVSLVMIDTFLPEGFLGLKYSKPQLAKAIRRPFEEIFRLARRGLSNLPKTQDHAPQNQIQLSEQNPLDSLSARRAQRNHQVMMDYLRVMEPYSGPVLLLMSEARARPELLKNPKGAWESYVLDLKIETIKSQEIDVLEDLSFVTHVASAIEEFMREIET